MLLSNIIVAFTGLLSSVQAASLPAPVEVEAIAARDSPELEKRAQVIFTIGRALCGSGSTTSYTIFPWPGQVDVGCSEFNSAEQFDESLSSEAFGMTVCGSKTNFYRKNGNYDFYKNGGDGTLLGTCYPYNGPNRSCLVPLGSCGMSSRFRCQYSGKGKKICN